MKTINYITVLFLLLSISAFSQNLKKPSEGKVMVYITRSVDLAGGGLNFRVYDDDKFLGALPSRTYFTYECDPGKHLFWAASENRDYVEADLEANKTYVIDLKAKIGMFIAAVSLEPYTQTNKRHVKRVNRVLKRHVNAYIADSDKTEDKEENIAAAMEAYNKIRDRKSSKIKKLSPNMNFKQN